MAAAQGHEHANASRKPGGRFVVDARSGLTSRTAVRPDARLPRLALAERACTRPSLRCASTPAIATSDSLTSPATSLPAPPQTSPLRRAGRRHSPNPPESGHRPPRRIYRGWFCFQMRARSWTSRRVPDPAFGNRVHAGRPHVAQHGLDPGAGQMVSPAAGAGCRDTCCQEAEDVAGLVTRSEGR